jgi:hypothetical protein
MLKALPARRKRPSQDQLFLGLPIVPDRPDRAELRRRAAQIVQEFEDGGFFPAIDPDPESIFGFERQPEPFSRIVTLTPDKARRALAFNTRNRIIHVGAIVDLADQNLNDGWHLINDSMTFTSSMVMGNGQHRNFQVIITGKPIQINVMFGLHDDSVFVQDQGIHRTHASNLEIKRKVQEFNKKQYEILVAAAMIVFPLVQGREPWQKRPEPTVEQVHAIIDLFPTLIDATQEFYSSIRKTGLSAAIGVAFAGLFMAFDKPAKGSEFIRRLIAGGAQTPEGTPLYALQRALNSRSKSKNNRMKVTQARTMVQVVHAWNAFYRDRPLQVVSTSLNNDESFPRIAGLPYARDGGLRAWSHEPTP